MKEIVEKLNEFAARVEKARGTGPSVETYHEIFSAFYKEAVKEMRDLLPVN